MICSHFVVGNAFFFYASSGNTTYNVSFLSAGSLYKGIIGHLCKARVSLELGSAPARLIEFFQD